MIKQEEKLRKLAVSLEEKEKRLEMWAEELQKSVNEFNQHKEELTQASLREAEAASLCNFDYDFVDDRNKRRESCRMSIERQSVCMTLEEPEHEEVEPETTVKPAVVYINNTSTSTFVPQHEVGTTLSWRNNTFIKKTPMILPTPQPLGFTIYSEDSESKQIPPQVPNDSVRRHSSEDTVCTGSNQPNLDSRTIPSGLLGRLKGRHPLTTAIQTGSENSIENIQPVQVSIGNKGFASQKRLGQQAISVQGSDTFSSYHGSPWKKQRNVAVVSNNASNVNQPVSVQVDLKALLRNNSNIPASVNRLI